MAKEHEDFQSSDIVLSLKDTPVKSLWSPDHSFLKPRLLAKRLKRLRSRSKSLYDGVESSLSFTHVNGPTSLTGDEFYASTECLPTFKRDENENKFYKCGSIFYKMNLNKNIDEEILEVGTVKSDSDGSVYSTSTKIGHSMENMCNAASEETTTIKSDSSSDIFQMPTSMSLLEEIEESLSPECSLKKNLFCPSSLITYRTSMRLCKIMPLSGKYKDTKTLHVRNPTKYTVKSELNQRIAQLTIQGKLLNQAKKAVATSSYHPYLDEQYFEAEKVLLQESVKYEALTKEIKRLEKLFEDYEDSVIESGLVNIRKLEVTIEKPSALSACLLVCIIVERDNVKISSSPKPSRDGSIRFTIPLNFSNLPQNFSISVQMYGAVNTKLPRSALLDVNAFMAATQKRTTSPDYGHCFSLLGKSTLEFNNNSLEGLSRSSKLHFQGQVTGMHAKGEIYLETLQEGFLDVMRLTDKDRIKKPTWERKWYRLTGLGFQGWNYPSQQDSESPSEEMILSQISFKAGDNAGVLTLRPFTFVLLLYDGDFTTKVVCAADTTEECNIWSEKLSLALKAQRNKIA